MWFVRFDAQRNKMVCWHGADASVENVNTTSIQCKFNSNKFNNKTHQ